MLSFWKKIIFLGFGFVAAAQLPAASIQLWGNSTAVFTPVITNVSNSYVSVQITNYSMTGTDGGSAFFRLYSPGGSYTYSLDGNASSYTFPAQNESGNYTLVGWSYAHPTEVTISSFSWIGNVLTISGNREVSYHVEVVNTSVEDQTVNVDIGGTIVKTQVISPFASATLSGVSSATDGSLCAVTATDSLHPRNGQPYDPFIVGPANSVFGRSYFVGHAPETLVRCKVVVQYNNISQGDSFVRAIAGSMHIGQVTSLAATPAYQYLTCDILLPVGASVAIQTDVSYHTTKQPSSTVVSTNNTLFHWIITIDAGGSNYEPNYGPEFTEGTQSTDFSNGQTVTTSPGGATTVVNAGALVPNGQTATSPEGVIGQTGGSSSVPGVTTITGGQAGTDTGLLQGILANSQRIADGQNADGLEAEMPDPSALTRFAPDPSTVNSLNGMNPLSGVSIPAGVAPSVTLPFGQLGVDGFTDQSLSFGNSNLTTWADAIRMLLLFCVSAFFAFHHIRVISKGLSSI